MNHTRTRFAIGCSVYLFACGPVEELESAAAMAAITNGAHDVNHTAVVKFAGCTGTFISPQLILTATHCLPVCRDSEVGCYEKQSNPLAWVGRDGPYRSTALDASRLGCSALDNASDPDCAGNAYPIDYVFFPRPTRELADPPDVAILHTTVPFVGEEIALMEPEFMPSPSNINYWHEGAAVAMVGYSNNKGANDTRRRVGRGTIVGNATTPWNKNRAFGVDGPQAVCPGDSGGPALFRVTEYGRTVTKVGGVASEGNCRNGGNYAYIPGAFTRRVLKIDHSVSLGCFGDDRKRALPNFVEESDRMTATHCIDRCIRHGHVYAGVQFGRQCFCGGPAVKYDQYGELHPEACGTACSGDDDKTCGGRWANSIYKLSRGCYKDSPNQRDIQHLAAWSTDMSATRCIEICDDEGYTYAGLQYGGQCFCGNLFGHYTASNRCKDSCTGDPLQPCGGRWANDIF